MTDAQSTVIQLTNRNLELRKMLVARDMQIAELESRLKLLNLEHNKLTDWKAKIESLPSLAPATLPFF